MFRQDVVPTSHIAFLEENACLFKPKVAFDVGSAVMRWSRHVKRLHPECTIIHFDANDEMEFLYQREKVEYQIALPSDTDGLKFKYYFNRQLFGGNSYYREVGFDQGKHFPEDRYLVKEAKKLDSLVKENQHSMPDIIKIDVQGAEKDVLRGATEVLKYCRYLILELKEMEYNKNSPKANEVVEYLKSLGYLCIAHKISDKGVDYNSCFINAIVKNNIVNYDIFF